MGSDDIGGNVIVRPRLHAVLIAFAVALTATQLGFLLREVADAAGRVGPSRRPIHVSRLVQDLAMLAFGLLLAASAPRRSGLTLGTTKHRNKALLTCLVVFGVAVAYRVSPLNDNQPITWTILRWQSLSTGSSSRSSWLISPLAQELIFSGFILGSLKAHFPKRWTARLPITTAVLITALLFGVWHLIPDFTRSARDLDFVSFRLLYTTAGMIAYGMTRIWTGSILYAVLTHTAVNLLFFERFGVLEFGL